MAVAEIIRLPRRTFSDEAAATKYTEVYLVRTDDRDDDGYVIKAASGVPARGDAHASDPDAVCVAVDGEELRLRNKIDSGSVVADGAWWRVKADFSTDQQEVQASQSPLYPTRPAAYNETTTIEEEPTDFDKDGDPIANFAGDPYVPALKRRVSVRHLEITVNLLEVDLPDPTAFENKVNSATFQGGAAGTVYCDSVLRSGPFIEHGVTYWTCRVTVSYREEGWLHKILNAGLRELIGGALVHVVDADGQKITEPLPLNSDGTAIKDGDMSGATFTDYELVAAVSFTGIDF